MKKFKKVKSLLFGFILTFVFCFINTNVYAKTMTPDEIQGPVYVIGSHVFTREVNETTGYQGRLTTNLIMLASQTIESSDLDSMIIYYKTATGMWINGLTGSPIEAPESFVINYTNMQLEEDNNTVSAPKTPILTLNDGPLSIDDETDMMTYQLDIYIDDIDDKSNKVDGVEISMVDYDSHVTRKDLPYGENFGTVVTVLDNYSGDVLEIGKKYHRDFITFENTPDGYYTINARTYVKDANGKKSYSDWVIVSINVDKTLPQLRIVNNYSNPDYVYNQDGSYLYKLGIDIPDAYVYKIKPEKFAYITNCADGTFAIDEEFIVDVAENSIKSCWAQMGYINSNGDFKYYYTGNEEENRIYYTIDTRALTAPVLTHAGYGRSAVMFDRDFYYKQDKNTLDYQIDGIELYRVNPGYELVLVDNIPNAFYEVKPPLPGEIGGGGIGYYTARAYATNALGKKVFSEYSNIVAVVQTPEIEVSDIIDGKVNVRIKNIDDYFYYDSILKYEVIVDNEIVFEMLDLDETATVNIDSTSRLSVRVYIKDDGRGSGTDSESVTVVVE